ncbi:carbon monoxide dehydrogenase [Kaistia algarum]|uniref:xanthine dehydrogenase family protein molybdopterin-binding subunit n=1 Tax=Kaistia algarum TaxID=2083279 RepID=UPI000CE78B3E|nr:xanthine dehydrogenase family protein molybdopterin-binding subunit [Kaistia algarum]MCX5515194.1 xanthine dehydrogenase family protein molybdopterin-binding subunit [Kaistia algarum]PPE79913.1 carbon monoxide dehydrogenase [Kaistia algarum]
MNDMTPPRDSAPRKFGMGAPVRRKEDRALITGRGFFTGDYTPPGTLHAVVVRSMMAHADIRVGGVETARAAPGVRLVLTGADVADYQGPPAKAIAPSAVGPKAKAPRRPLLVADRVRHVGDPIAFIVADTVDAAKAAAELIDIDYDTLPAVTDCRAALGPDAPLVWPDLGTNVALTYKLGNVAATDAAFARAAKIVRLDVVNQRLVANYMETRGIIAEYDAATDRFTLTLGTQGGHSMRDIIARDILKIDPKRIRVVTPDVGGGFGTKAFVYHEYPLAALAAKQLGQPVKWLQERGEHFLSDAHGRDNLTVGEMALDADGRFMALRVDLLSNIGAYMSQFGADIAAGGVTMSTGLYDIAAMDVTVRCVYTTTTPTDAYRGAGRPEAAYLIERLVDLCGRETGLGPIEIRKRNFIRADQLPYLTQGGRNYDTGDFTGHLDRNLALVDYDGFPARAEAARLRGKLRGLGIATYVEACAFPGSEPATVKLNADGTVTLLIGTQTNGQGHGTAYSQFVAAHLGIDIDKVEVIQGDTDRVATGEGTGGSRSIPLGAVSVDRASLTLASQIKQIASDELEVGVEDLELADGGVSIVGTDRSLSLAEIAAKAKEPALLTAVGEFVQDECTYPNGTHIAEVEIDPETGVTTLIDFSICDDFGVTVNPILLAGQLHGGVAQGIGQALNEGTIFDADGQLLTASLLDYCLPRADNFPSFRLATHNVPSVTNVMGIKGAGEAGTIGATPAVMNAVVDALARAKGITHIDMPATPERIWAALND